MDEEQLSIQRMMNPFWFVRELDRHLRGVGRYVVPTEIQERIYKFVEHQIKYETSEISVGSVFYRARIHGLSQERPYTEQELGAPPKGLAKAGRINPEGIPYLYLADTAETAVAEVRAWKGAVVSVGKFVVNTQLRAVNLSVVPLEAIKDPAMNRDRYFGLFIHNLLKSMYFAAPAHSEDRLAYLSSQYVAELFKTSGIDAIIYSSVMREDGKNIAVFDTNNARCERVSPYVITRVGYEMKPGVA